jgi:hypothetical protein
MFISLLENSLDDFLEWLLGHSAIFLELQWHSHNNTVLDLIIFSDKIRNFIGQNQASNKGRLPKSLLLGTRSFYTEKELCSRLLSWWINQFWFRSLCRGIGQTCFLITLSSHLEWLSKFVVTNTLTVKNIVNIFSMFDLTLLSWNV